MLLGGVGLTLAAGGTALLWRPNDRGAPHAMYFSQLNELLKREGPGRPIMLVDLDRVNGNIDHIVSAVGAEKTYRVVVKSLPSIPLLAHVMNLAKTQAMMVFHQPFLTAITGAFPHAEILIGRPLPVAAIAAFYKQQGHSGFDAANQIQWLIDTPERLAQYQTLARQLGVAMRINLEIDVGARRGGLPEPAAVAPILRTIATDPHHLTFTGFMGYEPHLSDLQANLHHPGVRQVLDVYSGFIEQAKLAGFDPAALTLNGAGSHTLGIYRRDRLMNDLSAGSAVLKPAGFDTLHLANHLPAIFIATPVLKRHDEPRIPGDPRLAKLRPLWDPNTQRQYHIHRGNWQARVVSPEGVADPDDQNTGPLRTSTSVNLQVDDYMFLRPAQSEHVMLQFDEIFPFQGNQLTDPWPVFHQTG